MYKVPLVVTWHNAVLGDGIAPAAVRQTLRAVAMGADLTLGASRDLVALATRLGARNVRFSPIAAPVLPQAKTSREEQRRVLGASPDDTVSVTVSRLAPQKNLGMVLDIASAVRDRPDLAIRRCRRGSRTSEAAASHHQRPSSGRTVGSKR